MKEKKMQVAPPGFEPVHPNVLHHRRKGFLPLGHATTTNLVSKIRALKTNNINFVILGNPYGLLQDSPKYCLLFFFFLYQVWTPYAAQSNYKSNYKLISIYKLARH